MARPIRIEFEGAVYHVMSRGHERGRIFADDEDRERYLDDLRHVVEEKNWIVHGFCLMTNHVHLLIETPVPNLSGGMQVLNGRYSQAYNRRHSRTGHLLEGRFQAILVEKESYLLELCRYIVLNPVRARMVASPSQWPWSNYRSTSGMTFAPDWLDVNWTLAQFGKGSAAREAYRRFVSEGKGLPSPLDQVTGQVYLGGAEFLKEVEQRLKTKAIDRSIPRSQREFRFVPIEAVRKAVAEAFEIESESLSRSRGGADKAAAIYLARRLTGLTGVEIGRAFDVTPGRVSNVTREVEGGQWPELRRRLEKLERVLTDRHKSAPHSI